MTTQEVFVSFIYNGKNKEALDVIPLDQVFLVSNEMHDFLTSACMFADTDDVNGIQMILDRGFDKRNIRLTNRCVLVLLNSYKTKIVERLFMITETHTKYPQLFSSTFVTVAKTYLDMFRLLIYMFDCGARPEWMRCCDWHIYLQISAIYNDYENVCKSSIALIGIATSGRKDVMRIISRVLWSTRADERWYKLK